MNEILSNQTNSFFSAVQKHTGNIVVNKKDLQEVLSMTLVYIEEMSNQKNEDYAQKQFDEIDRPAYLAVKKAFEEQT